jgi:hypothetical protein
MQFICSFQNADSIITHKISHMQSFGQTVFLIILFLTTLQTMNGINRILLPVQVAGIHIMHALFEHWRSALALNMGNSTLKQLERHSTLPYTFIVT